MDRLTALVLLRWRLDLRAILGRRERVAGLVLMVPFMAVGSALTAFFAWFAVRGLERHGPEALMPVLSAVATAVGVFWALSPLLTGIAFSEAHDMSRLLHFPIPPWVLAASSLLANLAQPTALAQAPVILALAVALAERPVLVPFVAAGLALSFAFILCVAQAVGLVLHGLARNRRFHDLALLAAVGFGFVVSLAPLMLLAGGARVLWPLVGVLVRTDWFALSPFAWGVRAAVAVGRGDGSQALAWTTAALVALGAGLSASVVLIHRIYRGEVVTGWAAPARTGSWLRLPGRVGAIVEKDLRSAWRDPALKASLVLGLTGPLLFLFVLSRTPAASHSGYGLLFLASFMGLSGFGANPFGLERRGVALLLGFPVPRWKILVGKNLGSLCVRLPAFLLLVAAGGWVAPVTHVPAAAAILFSSLLVTAGVDNYVAILFPVAAPAPGQNPYRGAASGRGPAAALLGAALLATGLLLSSPFVFLAWVPALLGRPWLWLGSLPLALAGAAAVYAMLVAGGERLLQRREPEMLERILGES